MQSEIASDEKHIGYKIAPKDYLKSKFIEKKIEVFSRVACVKD